MEAAADARRRSRTTRCLITVQWFRERNVVQRTRCLLTVRLCQRVGSCPQWQRMSFFSCPAPYPPSPTREFTARRAYKASRRTVCCVSIWGGKPTKDYSKWEPGPNAMLVIPHYAKDLQGIVSEISMSCTKNISFRTWNGAMPLYTSTRGEAWMPASSSAQRSARHNNDRWTTKCSGPRACPVVSYSDQQIAQWLGMLPYPYFNCFFTSVNVISWCRLLLYLLPVILI